MIAVLVAAVDGEVGVVPLVAVTVVEGRDVIVVQWFAARWARWIRGWRW